MQGKKYCLLTNDVELTSIVNNDLSVETGKKVLSQGLPKLLKLYKKYDIKSTFFMTGRFVEEFPSVVEMIQREGHEIGSHGYRHEIDKAFDVLSLEEQIKHLERAKDLLIKNGASKVVSFRAPALRVNSDTIEALSKNGFTIDSSTASQRFDFFLSFGGLNKLKWLFQPRKPYRIAKNNFYARGNSNICELPVSALIMPYIGTTMRIFPLINSILGWLLRIESKLTGKPIVFLIHPIEVISEKSNGIVKRRTKNPIKYLLADKLRRFLKLKNLGDKGLYLYEKEIIKMTKRGFKFVTLSQYRDIRNF